MRIREQLNISWSTKQQACKMTLNTNSLTSPVKTCRQVEWSKK
jgi:plastocyanin domain-containing protein